jgi:predicted ATPase
MSASVCTSTDPFFVLTGPPGSGKTTLLQHLRTRGFAGIDEPARQILAEQRSIAGNVLTNRDARLFVELMLSRMIGEYRRIQTPSEPVFFDRHEDYLSRVSPRAYHCADHLCR